MNVLRFSRFYLSAFLLVLLSSQVLAQAPAPPPKGPDVEALQQQLESLQTQVTALQDQIKKLTTVSATSGGQDTQQTKSADAQQDKGSGATQELTTKQTVSQPTALYQTNSEDQDAAARYDNAPLDPRYPNYFRLPGTKTFMKIGGYAKSDFTFDPRPAGDQERFIPASIPIPAPKADTNNSTVSVRPSRINVDFLVPYKEERSIRFFLEVDFFGSSSTTPRLRHAYAQGKNLLVGQTFSTFMDPDAGPDTLDFQGPNSQVSIRNPQMRYTFKLQKSTTFSMAIEKPNSDVAFKTDAFSALPNSPSPDGTFQLRHEMKSGHVQLSAVLRDIAASVPDGRSDSVFGWGFNVAGLYKLGKDNLTYQGSYGDGIARYFNDTGGLGIDAAVKSTQNPVLEALPIGGFYGGYQHLWSEKLRSSLVYGFLQSQTTAAEANSQFHRSEYGAVNLIWSPFPQVTLGSEFLYGWRVNKDNSTGNAPRIQLSAKYNFLQMKSSSK